MKSLSRPAIVYGNAEQRSLGLHRQGRLSLRRWALPTVGISAIPTRGGELNKPVKVPFLDLRMIADGMKADMTRAFERVMASGQWILGSELAAFETAFARYCGTQHCIGVGTRLDALKIALQAMGIGPGDEVIVPANTFIATWLAADEW